MTMPSFEILTHKSFLAFLFGSFVSLVTITNPISKIPLFVSLTTGMSREKRREQARKACLYAFAILTVSLFAGEVILTGFGISYGALRIAGGIVIAVLGYRMLFNHGDASHAKYAHRAEIAFFPLALPGISGPGAIAVVIGVSTEIAELKSGFLKTVAYSGSVLSIFVTCLLMWFVFRFAQNVSRRIGPDGMEALTRLMGFLLVCIGVQFVGSGVRTFIAGS